MARKVFPIWSGVDTVALPERRAFQTSDLRRGMHVLYTAGRDAIIAREVIGRGEVFVIAVPEIFANGNLATGNHLALLTAQTRVILCSLSRTHSEPSETAGRIVRNLMRLKTRARAP